MSALLLYESGTGATLSHPSPVADAYASFPQSRGVMFFSFAYLAADSSTIGRVMARSPEIQSVTACHCLPSHCWNFTRPEPSWSAQEILVAGISPSALIAL